MKFANSTETSAYPFSSEYWKLKTADEPEPEFGDTESAVGVSPEESR